MAMARESHVPLGTAAGVGFGIALMLVSQSLVMPLNDAIVKQVVSFARFAGNFILLLPLAPISTKGRIPLPARPGLQVIRGLLMVASNLFFIFGLRQVPLAMAAALTFVAPLTVAALAPWLLGERSDAWRWTAVVAGFLGAMVILRPGSDSVPPAAILPLMSGISFSLYLIITRKLAGTGSAIVTQTITAGVATATVAILLPFTWVTPTLPEALVLALIGLLSCIGHVLLTKAHEHAPASTLAPFTYTGIITAITLGWLWFGQLPDLLSLVGAAIVIASGLAILLRSRAAPRG
jgi:drug/metabolite transporter (DMT)-like permease